MLLMQDNTLSSKLKSPAQNLTIWLKMADGASSSVNKHDRNSALTPKSVTSVSKRFRIAPDHNSSLEDLTGMQIDKEDNMQINTDNIVDNALSSVNANLTNSATKQKPRGQHGQINTDELCVKLLSGVAAASKETTKAVIEAVQAAERRKHREEIELISKKVQRL